MTTQIQRMKVMVRGAVQGVGFRPFVYKLARELTLRGWVRNCSEGVWIEVEGSPPLLEEFVLRLNSDRPPLAVIHGMESSILAPIGYERFEIKESDDTGSKTALILPDIATCHVCLQEILDPKNRRYFYPFTNCTNCGPRYSIIESMPYDRAHTSMHTFRMCEKCREEYENPSDRRFHAQPNACPHCGPRLEMWDRHGEVMSQRSEALQTACATLRSGGIVALKGMGGFQLLVNALDDESVRRLRLRKHRAEKPLALMYPHLQAVRDHCAVSPLEERLLTSPEAPIVLLRKLAAEGLSPQIAPNNPWLGVMLPYTPLHHLLMHLLGEPVVATSANLSEEPLCIDEHEALKRLADMADVFLVHDRPIVRQVDDSVVRVMMNREQVLRRARGYAPMPIRVKEELPTVLAVGAHLKNTVALSMGREIFLSQHIGDLETQAAYQSFRRICQDLCQLHEVAPHMAACDLHPDYLSSKFARGLNIPLAWVQHHHAHVLSCMAENELKGNVLGVCWDGTGYGPDGVIWGGEFLHVKADHSFERKAHLRPFRLPGGEMAIKEPRRCALGIAFELWQERAFDAMPPSWSRHFTESEQTPLQRMLYRGINSPMTTSAGRLFDAVASLLELRQGAGFEGQAAMEVEFCASAAEDVTTSYPFALSSEPPWVVDWEPMIRGILADLATNVPTAVIAAQFHNTLAECIVAVAKQAMVQDVALTGGCFQNRLLTERAVTFLEAAGFRPYWHQRIPTNDGGIAVGQVIAAAQQQPATPHSNQAFSALNH